MSRQEGKSTEVRAGHNFDTWQKRYDDRNAADSSVAYLAGVRPPED